MNEPRIKEKVKSANHAKKLCKETFEKRGIQNIDAMTTKVFPEKINQDFSKFPKKEVRAGKVNVCTDKDSQNLAHDAYQQNPSAKTAVMNCANGDFPLGAFGIGGG